MTQKFGEMIAKSREMAPQIGGMTAQIREMIQKIEGMIAQREEWFRNWWNDPAIGGLVPQMWE
jgi:hypothetical protein